MPKMVAAMPSKRSNMTVVDMKLAEMVMLQLIIQLRKFFQRDFIRLSTFEKKNSFKQREFFALHKVFSLPARLLIASL